MNYCKDCRHAEKPGKRAVMGGAYGTLVVRMVPEPWLCLHEATADPITGVRGNRCIDERKGRCGEGGINFESGEPKKSRYDSKRHRQMAEQMRKQAERFREEEDKRWKELAVGWPPAKADEIEPAYKIVDAVQKARQELRKKWAGG